MNRRLMNTTWLQGRINALYAIHKNTVEDYGGLVQSLNEECDILCEIIPGYKITTNMQAGAVAGGADGGGGGAGGGERKQKEVFNVEKLETESLKQYSHFLDLIGKLQKKPHPEEQAMGCRLCCKLLPHAHSFNYNDKLLRLAVNFANAKATRVAQPALKALSELLSDEMVSESTQYVVEAILEIVRRSNHALNPKLLTLLLSIRVAMIDVHKQDITEEKAKMKRMKKEDKELARQLRKANARKDRAELAARQTRILNKVFVVYLRVLQASRTCPRDHQAKILAPTLEGLVKFAPLVNQELFRELGVALKELLAIQKRAATGSAQKHRDFVASVQLGGVSAANNNNNGDGDDGDDDDGDGMKCTVAVALHALVAAAALANKDETLEATDWREDLVDYQEKLFQILPEALEPPAIPKQSSNDKKDAAMAAEDEEGGGNLDTRSTASSVISTTSSLASTAFSIAQSMANHTQYVRGSVMREWTYRCNLVIRAFDSLILTQRHLPTARVAGLVRRIVNLAAGAPHHISMSLIALAHRAAIRFPAIAAMFMGGADYEGGVGSSGVGGGFRFDATELSNANPDGNFTWEAALWRNSFQPALRDVGGIFAQHYHRLAQTRPGMPPPVSKQLDSLYPDELLDKFDPTSGLIVPAPVQRGGATAAARGMAAKRRQRNED